MQTKYLNSYKITHENGVAETINSETITEALENLSVSEDVSLILKVYMEKTYIKTLVDDEVSSVPFTSIVSDESVGSIASPASGTIHVGDMLAFMAIPADNYNFVKWTKNGETISTEASFVYTMEELPEDDSSFIFEAVFELQELVWATVVSPTEATSAGCMTFPASGSTEIGSNASMIAIVADGYTFDHWERYGTTVGSTKQLDIAVNALDTNETACEYTAVFVAEV